MLAPANGVTWKEFFLALKERFSKDKLMDVADASAQGRIVSVLEGGYDLQGLKESVAAHLTALMGA